MTKGATISDCGNYRYSLTRIWDENKPKVMFIMLNPSTADANNDDPTIRRCIGFAKSWGFGGLYVCNLFAFRATNPKELLNVDNPFGDLNIWHTKQLSDKVDLIICAWGNYPIVKKLLRYETAPINLLFFCINKLHSIDTTVKGVPKHPLYLNSDLKPKRWAYKYEGRINDLFVCKGCKHTLPKSYCIKTKNWCYLCDPNVTLKELLNDDTSK